MKTTLMATMATVTLLVGSQAAYAASEQGAYVGGQYNFAKIKFDDTDVNISESASPKAITVLGGYSFNPYFAAEGRVGFSAGSDEVLPGADTKIDSYFSVLARGTYPINELFNVYGLLGFTHGKVKTEVAGGSASTSDGSVSFGAGAEVTFAKQHGVSVEYAQLFKGSESGTDYKVTAVSLGYRYHF